MIEKSVTTEIEKLIDNKRISKIFLLSNSFGINCLKINTLDNISFIVKYYYNKSSNFNAISSETKNLLFFEKEKINYFPKVYKYNADYLVMSNIDNNKKKPNETNKDFLEAILKLHTNFNNDYGFYFDTQIGGLRQNNNFCNSWVEFYRDKRLGYIFELINKSKKMDVSINNKIELLLKKLSDFIPDKPKSSLIHGDLWEGNILFLDGCFAGFIDPGSFYGHNELEIAYLRWFNPIFIDKNFLDKYNDVLSIDKNYLEYESLYQLYYSLLNVYLWDRSYVSDVKRLIRKIKI